MLILTLLEKPEYEPDERHNRNVPESRYRSDRQLLWRSVFVRTIPPVVAQDRHPTKTLRIDRQSDDIRIGLISRTVGID